MRTSLSQWLLAMTATALLTQTAWASETDRPVHILASLPVTYGLSQLLLKGTPVVLERAAPANLPGSRQSAYFSGRGAEALAKLAATADAVVGVRSAWPDDSLYPMARRSNIRVVEVSFSALPDKAERDYLNTLPTSFVLDGEDVDRLRVAARDAILASPEIKRLIANGALRMVGPGPRVAPPSAAPPQTS